MIEVKKSTVGLIAEITVMAISVTVLTVTYGISPRAGAMLGLTHAVVYTIGQWSGENK